MPRTNRSFTTTIVSASILLILGLLCSAGQTPGRMGLVPTVQAQEFDRARTKDCSLGSLQGRYAYAFQGTVLPPLTPEPLPVAASGIVEFDGKGNLRGSDIGSGGGEIIERTYTGTYTVNEDCTSTVTVRFETGFPPGTVATVKQVIVDNGREILFIETTPGTVVTGILKKM